MATQQGAPAPNATVYVRNLEERIKPDELISALTELFSEYGTILDIVAKRNLKAKGQAFIVFESVESATKAIEEVQGFKIFGKEMVLQFAKSRSDAFVKRGVEQGEWGEEEFEGHKRRRVAEKDKKKAASLALASAALNRTTALPSTSTSANSTLPIKATRGAGLKSTNASASAVIPDEYLPPNKILFVQNLPDGVDIEGIFSRFEGFREVRLVPGRKGIAFVEYESETGAIGAKENVAGLKVGGASSGGVGEGQVLKVTYQRQ